MLALLWTGSANAGLFVTPDSASTELALGTRLCGTTAGHTAYHFDHCPRYRSLVSRVSEDISLQQRKAREKLGGKPIDVFEQDWLRSSKTRFVLTGIIFRGDRQPFLSGACAEVRLVYRLAGKYQDEGTEQETYLPFTLLLAYEIPGKNRRCAKLAADSLDVKLQEKAWIEAITTAPFRVELNFLNLRVEAPILEKSAGYAEYFMRTLRPKGEDLVVVALENTPDVDRILKSATKKKAYLDWIERNLGEIASGTAHLPDDLCASHAVSVAPFGALRKINAPFSQLPLPNVDLKAHKKIATTNLLLRRLNGMSCQGCHQTRSDAGFHFLGKNLEKSFKFNRTTLPASAHFFSEQSWRQQVTESLAKGHEVPARPFPGNLDAVPSAGSVCTLSTNFEPAGCGDSLSCRHPWEADAPEVNVGYCQLKKAPIAGEPCLLGNWTNRGGMDDALEMVLNTDCFGRAQCLPQKIGFPGGLCAASCEDNLPNSVCHPVPALQKFTDCRAANRGLAKCFEQAATPVSLRACGIDMPCRPDYVCALREAGDETKGGACVPPYFLPQLNTRGHEF
ncbi:MAG: hypothetical protein H6617_12130 [Bdellovibrionaceae bacterium]|nr:hypothetical protein [Pseudobdellovibrionaceae bacterium]